MGVEGKNGLLYWDDLELYRSQCKSRDAGVLGVEKEGVDCRERLCCRDLHNIIPLSMQGPDQLLHVPERRWSPSI